MQADQRLSGDGRGTDTPSRRPCEEGTRSHANSPPLPPSPAHSVEGVLRLGSCSPPFTGKSAESGEARSPASDTSSSSSSSCFPPIRRYAGLPQRVLLSEGMRAGSAADDGDGMRRRQGRPVDGPRASTPEPPSSSSCTRAAKGMEGSPSAAPPVMSFKDRQRRAGRYGAKGSGSPRSSVAGDVRETAKDGNEREAEALRDAAGVTGASSGAVSPAEKDKDERLTATSPITPLPPAATAQEERESKSTPTGLSFKDRLRAGGSTTSSSLSSGAGARRRVVASPPLAHPKPLAAQEQPLPSRQVVFSASAQPSRAPVRPAHAPPSSSSGSLARSPRQQPLPDPPLQQQQQLEEGEGASPLVSGPPPMHERADTLECRGQRTPVSPSPVRTGGASPERPTAAVKDSEGPAADGSPQSWHRTSSTAVHSGTTTSAALSGPNSLLAFRRTSAATNSSDTSRSGADLLASTQNELGLRVCEEGEPEPVTLSMPQPRPLESGPSTFCTKAGGGGDRPRRVRLPGEGADEEEKGTGRAVAAPPPHSRPLRRPQQSSDSSCLESVSVSHVSGNTAASAVSSTGRTRAFESPTKAGIQQQSSPPLQPSPEKSRSSPHRQSLRSAENTVGRRCVSATALSRTRAGEAVGEGSAERSLGGTRRERGKMLGRSFGGLQATVPSTSSVLRGLSGEARGTMKGSTVVPASRPDGDGVGELESMTHPLLLPAQRRPRNSVEQTAFDFVQQLGLQQQAGDPRKPGSEAGKGGGKEGAGSRSSTLTSASHSQCPSEEGHTAKRQKKGSGPSSPEESQTARDCESTLEHSLDSHRVDYSHSELLLSGTCGSSFAATKDNRRTSTFSSLQFSMKRRLKGKVEDQRRKASVRAGRQKATQVSSTVPRGTGEDGGTETAEKRRKARKPTPAAAEKEEDEEEKKEGEGAIMDDDDDDADDDDRDGDDESAVETNGSSRDSAQQREETEAFLAEMERDEALLQKRVGMWETAEYIFIPIYETLESAESIEETVSRSMREAAGSGGGGVCACAASAKAVAASEGNSALQFFSPISSSKRSSGCASPVHHAHQGTTTTTPQGLTASASPSSLSVSDRASLTTAASFIARPLRADSSPTASPTATTDATRSSPHLKGGSPCSGGGGGGSGASGADGDGNERERRRRETMHSGTAFAFGSVAPNYNVEPSEDDPNVDCKVSARLLFDPDYGTMLLAPQDEVERYGYQASMAYNRTSNSPLRGADGAAADAAELAAGAYPSPPSSNRMSASSAPGPRNEEGEEGEGEEAEAAEDEGACDCDESFISKDSRGMDYSRYNAHTLYDHCVCCQRRPGCFLCLHCFKSVCPTHVQRHYGRNPAKCTLYLNILDIMTSFDRVFWCEKCRRFTWKYTEIYDPLVDQIAFTRGTYLPRAVRDIHCFGLETILQERAQSPFTAVAAAATASLTGSFSAGRMASFSASRMASLVGLPHPVSSGRPLQQVTYTQNTDSSFSLSASLASPPTTQTHFSRAAIPSSPRPFSLGLGCGGNRDVGAGEGGSITQRPRLSCASNDPPPLVATVATNLTSHGNLGAPMMVTTTATNSSPAKSPMAHMLDRDPAALTEGSVLPVGSAVSKLSALAVSVQGWRTTQEDAEAAFLVYIPELKTAAAAAAGAGGQEKRKSVGRFASGADPASPQQSQRDKDSGAALPRQSSEGEEAAKAEGAAADETTEKIPMAVFCVFDGHGGDAVAKLAAGHFESHLRSAIARARPDDIRARALLFYVKAESSFSPRQRAISHGSNLPSPAASMTSLMAPAIGAPPLHSSSLQQLPQPQLQPPQQSQPQQQQQSGSLRSVGGCRTTPALSAQDPSVDSGQRPPSGGGYRFSGPLLVPGAFRSGRVVEGGSPRFDSLGSSPQGLLGAARDLEEGLMGDVGLRAEEGEEEESGSYGSGGAACSPALVSSILAPITAASLAQHASTSDAQTAALISFVEPERSFHKDSAEPRGPSATDSKGLRPSNYCSPKLQAVQQQQQQQQRLVRQWEDDNYSAIAGTSTTNVSVGGGGGAGGCVNGEQHGPHKDGGDGSDCRAAPSAAALPQPPPPLDARRGSGGHYLNPTLALSPAAVVSVSEVEMLRGYFTSIIEDALLSLDDYLKNTEEGQRGDYNCVGCTACIVGITPNFILCANVGDSGACFYNHETIECISVKHRLTDPKEQARVQSAGYAISNGRIEGMLAVPRALGDFDFKQCGGRSAKEQAVVAVPDVTIRPTPTTTTAVVASAAAVTGSAGVDGDNAEDRWGILLACDGVWDTATLHQIHHALVNTPNDLDVASSAMEASLRAKELARHHRRGPVHYLEDTPVRGPGSVSSQSSSPISAQEPMPVGRFGPRTASFGLSKRGLDNEEAKRWEAADGMGGGEPHQTGSAKEITGADRDDGEDSYVEDVGGDPQATDGIDPRLLTAAAGVLAQCIAPADNEEGIGLDNCSLVLIERRA